MSGGGSKGIPLTGLRATDPAPNMTGVVALTPSPAVVATEHFEGIMLHGNVEDGLYFAALRREDLSAMYNFMSTQKEFPFHVRGVVNTPSARQGSYETTIFYYMTTNNLVVACNGVYGAPEGERIVLAFVRQPVLEEMYSKVSEPTQHVMFKGGGSVAHNPDDMYIAVGMVCGNPNEEGVLYVDQKPSGMVNIPEWDDGKDIVVFSNFVIGTVAQIQNCPTGDSGRKALRCQPLVDIKRR